MRQVPRRFDSVGFKYEVKKEHSSEIIYAAGHVDDDAKNLKSRVGFSTRKFEFSLLNPSALLRDTVPRLDEVALRSAALVSVIAEARARIQLGESGPGLRTLVRHAREMLTLLEEDTRIIFNTEVFKRIDDLRDSLEKKVLEIEREVFLDKPDSR